MDGAGGKYWPGMNIPKGKKEEEKNKEVVEIATIDRSFPSPPTFPDGFTFSIYKNNDLNSMDVSELRRISEFMDENNTMGEHSNVSGLSINTINSWLNTDGHVIVVYGDGHIVGCLLTITLHCNMNLKSGMHRVFTSYTSNLCVRPQYRSLGIAMSLIKLTMLQGIDRGIVNGYYMTAKTHHRCNAEIPSWYRPLDVEKAFKNGFKIPDLNNLKRQNIMKFNLKYKCYIPPGYSVEKLAGTEDNANLFVSSVEDWTIRAEKIEGKEWPQHLKITFSPTPDFALKYLTNFNNYVVRKDGRIVAIATIKDINIFVQDVKKKAHISELTYFICDPNIKLPTVGGKSVEDQLSDISSILTALTTVCSKQSCILYGYYTGMVAPDYVKRFAPITTSKGSNIEFYNSDFSLHCSQLNMPLL